MRILIVTPAYEPAWAFGGVVRCLSNLCRAMADQGEEVSVYTTNLNGQGGLLPVEIETQTNLGGVKVTYFPSTFGKNSATDSRALIKKLAETVKSFDIAYVSAIWQWMGIAVSSLARKNDIPVVIGTHGSFLPPAIESGKWKKTLYWNLALKKCINNASALHFTTQFEKHISKWLPEIPGYVVPNALLLNNTENKVNNAKNFREKFNVPKDEFLLLTVGRLDPGKRLDILLNAFKKIQDSTSQVNLAVVGDIDNEYAKKMQKLSQDLGISGKIIWTGFMEHSQLALSYRSSDLFVLTSAHENFSMVTIEAMAAGLPVVISDNVGVAEDVRDSDSGIVVSLDAKDFAQAVLNLMAAPERLNNMAKRASGTALEFYSGKQVAKKMIHMFEDVLSKNKSEKCTCR